MKIYVSKDECYPFYEIFDEVNGIGNLKEWPEDWSLEDYLATTASFDSWQNRLDELYNDN